MRLTGSGSSRTTSSSTASTPPLIQTRCGFMSGNLPRFLMPLNRLYSGQPIIEARATIASMALMMPSLYGFRKM